MSKKDTSPKDTSGFLMCTPELRWVLSDNNEAKCETCKTILRQLQQKWTDIEDGSEHWYDIPIVTHPTDENDTK